MNNYKNLKRVCKFYGKTKNVPALIYEAVCKRFPETCCPKK